MVLFKKQEKAVNRVILLEAENIQPNPVQPRTVFGENEIRSLAESIAANGLLQPITVRKKGDGYELVSGERRLRAMKYANIREIPCIVIDTTDRQAAVLALLENIQREDLNYFEEAAALRNLIVEWGISQQELGVKLGMAQSTIANKLRLLKFGAAEREQLLSHGLNERQARELLRLPHPETVESAAAYIAENHLNAAQTERYVDSLLQEPPVRKRQCSHPVVKDVRLFFNTINRAISVMNQSGINASAERIEKADCIEYIVRIPT